MELLNNDSQVSKIKFSIDELCAIHQSLNEVCKGIDSFEFEMRVGTSEQNIINLMNSFKEVINTMNVENENSNN